MAELLHAHVRTSTDHRAMVWPRPCHNLTFVPRRPQHYPGSQAGYKSWRHPLAPKLPTSQYNMPAPNPRIRWRHQRARKPRVGRREAPNPPPDRTDHLDQDLDLHQTFVPDHSERPVAGHAKCRLTAKMFQQPGLATYPLSAQLTPSLSLGCTSLFCVNKELQPC